MPRSRKPETARKSPAAYSLGQLCNFVVTCTRPFEDLKEQIAEKAFELARGPSLHEAVRQLEHLVDFYESLERKNEENLRDLAEVCILLGDLFHTFKRYSQAIAWFEKAVVIDDQSPEAYQNIARCYQSLGELDKAIKSLEQEVRVAPENYFAYLYLAEMYEKAGQSAKMESALEKLLKRDPHNILALHMLIVHYSAEDPSVDVEFLRKRLLSVDGPLSRRELVVWTYHMCAEKRFDTALQRLIALDGGKAPDPIVHALAAIIHDRQGKEDERRRDVRAFAGKSNGNPQAMQSRLSEITRVFGARASRILAPSMKNRSPVR